MVKLLPTFATLSCGRWFKLLPTFGGRVVTLADGLRLEGGELVMELQKTKVRMAPGGTADILPSHG